MYELDAGQWLVGWLAAVVVGLAKAGLPGVGILAVPLFASIVPAKESTGLLLPILIVGDLVGVAYYRRHAVWPHLVRIFPWAATGIVAGRLALGRLSDGHIRPLIAVIVLVMLAAGAWRSWRRLPEESLPTDWWFAAGLGLLAGFTTMVANAAGPVMVVYLLAMRLPKTAFIGTGAWYFLLLNVFKVPFSVSLGLINPDSLLLNLKLAPAVLLGAWVGIRFARHVPEKAFGVLVQGLAAVGAVRLLW